MDIKKLLDFKLNAVYARTSILGFVEILRSQGDGFANPGEESNDLGIQDDDIQSLQRIGQTALNNREEATKALQEQNSGAELQVPPLPASISTQTRLQNQSRTSSSLSQQIPEPTAHLQFTEEQYQQERQPQAELSSASAPYGVNQFGNEQQSFDVCHPFFDPAMLDLFPDGEMPDLSQFETVPMNFYDLEFEDWNMSSTAPSESQSAF